MTSSKRLWPVLVLCCALSFVSTGTGLGLGALFTDIMDTFAVSRATASLVQSLCNGLIFLTGVISGHVLRRQGPRVTVITGSVLATAGCVVAFLATHIVQVIVGIGVLGGIGISFIYLTSITVPGIVFHENKSLALSVVSLFMAVGSISYPLLLMYVNGEYSLRGTFLILAAINCQMILCGALIGLLAPATFCDIAVTTESERDETTHGVEGEKASAAVASDTMTRDNHGNDTTSRDNHGNDTTSRDNRAQEQCSTGLCPRDSETTVLYTKPCPNLVDEIQLVSEMKRSKANDDSLLLPLNDVAERSKAEKRRSVELNGERQFRPSRPCCDCLGKLLTISCMEPELFRDTQFVVFAVLGPSSSLFFLQPVIFMTDMVRANGLTVEDGSFFLTTLFVGNVLGRPLAGILYRLLRSRILIVYAMSLTTGGVTCLFFLFIQEYAHFVAVSFFFGLSFGVMSASVPMIYLEILGPRQYAVGLGFEATMEGVFLVLAGPYGGLIRDLTNSYKPLYYTACVHGLALGIVLMSVAQRCNRRS